MQPQSRSVGAIATLAGRQHGVVARSQLAESGLSPQRIRTAVRRGHLHPIHRGVFAVGHPRLSQEARWLAAVLACGPGAVLSHGPAGQLLGILDRRQRFALHVSLTVDRSPAGIVTHRPRSLPPMRHHPQARHPGDHRHPNRLGPGNHAPLTADSSRLRAGREAAAPEPRSPRRPARTTTPATAAPAPSAALLAERALPLEATRSRLEEIALETCRDHALPIPAVNVPLLGYEVDLLWESARFVAEADGGDHLEPRDSATRQRARHRARPRRLPRPALLLDRIDDRARVAAEIADPPRAESPDAVGSPGSRKRSASGLRP